MKNIWFDINQLVYCSVHADLETRINTDMVLAIKMKYFLTKFWAVDWIGEFDWPNPTDLLGIEESDHEISN